MGLDGFHIHISPALAECWQQPFIALGAHITPVPPEADVAAAGGVGGQLEPTRPGRWRTFRISLAGITMEVDFRQWNAEVSHASALQQPVPLKAQRAASPLHLSARGWDSAQENLRLLVERVLMASGGVQSELGGYGRVVLRMPGGSFDAFGPGLRQVTPEVEVIPDLRILERIKQGIALDETARLHRQGGVVRLFAGQGIDPPTRQSVWYVAADASHRLRGRRPAMQMLDDVQRVLLAGGAVPIAPGVHITEC